MKLKLKNRISRLRYYNLAVDRWWEGLPTELREHANKPEASSLERWNDGDFYRATYCYELWLRHSYNACNPKPSLWPRIRSKVWR